MCPRDVIYAHTRGGTTIIYEPRLTSSNDGVYGGVWEIRGGHVRRQEVVAVHCVATHSAGWPALPGSLEHCCHRTNNL